jgi:uncharacterized membrane-anchored protein YhcB (DUF1043 family)
MDKFIQQSAPYLIYIGLIGVLVVVGLLIYALARLSKTAAMTEDSLQQQKRMVDHQKREIELTEESVALQRETNRLLKEWLDRSHI